MMALDFASSSAQWVNLGAGYSGVRNVPGCTIMAWVNVRSIPSPEPRILAVSTGTSATGHRAGLSLRSAENRYRASFRCLDADAFTAVNSTTAITLGTWVHVAGVARYTASIAEVYVNGALETSVAASAPWGTNSQDTGSLAAAIAAIPDGSSSQFDGLQDDLRIYGRALSASEVATIFMSRGRDRIVHGLASRWSLHEGAPGVAASGTGAVRDRGPRSAHGTPVNGPLYAPSFAVWRSRAA